jgi:hypothetical protein
MVNELQSRANSKIVQDRLNDTAFKGYFTGGVVPFGYSSISVTIPNSNIEKKQLVINSKESYIVERIFNLAESGVSGKPLGVKSIAKTLNDEGYLYRGKKWNKNKVDKILNDTTYYGKRIWGKARITRAKDNPPITIDVPAIITKNKFDSVQRGLETRRPLTSINTPINTYSKGERSKTLLVGLLKCNQCGSNLRLMYGKKRNPLIQDSRYLFYSCPKRSTTGCTCPNIRRDHLDKIIINEVLLQVLTPENISEIVLDIKDKINSVTKNDQKDLLKLNNQHASIKIKINNLYDKIADEILELDETLNENLQNKKTQLKALEKSIEVIKCRSKIPLKKFGKNHIQMFVEAATLILSNSNTDSCKQLLLKIIDKILVKKNEIIVRGTKFILAEFVSKTKMGTSLEVPTFVSIWR